MPLSTDQQARLIGQQYESMPAMPNSQFLKDKMRLLTSQKGADNNQIDLTMQQNNSVSNLDGDGHRSDFTFVLS